MAISTPPSANRPLKALFIGNSQMLSYNLPEMIRLMAQSSGGPCIEVTNAAVGGGNLKRHWEAGLGPDAPRAVISAKKWDYVVIQEIYSNSDASEFEAYATRFDEDIRLAGAKTIVFATANVAPEYGKPGYPYPDAFKALNGMQVAFSQKRRLLCAAGGYAWMKYLGPDPTAEERLDLYDSDKGHPGTKGTYIYACLLYCVMTGLNPEGLPHEFKNIRGGIRIPRDEAVKMQQAAWEEYQETGMG